MIILIDSGVTFDKIQLIHMIRSYQTENGRQFHQPNKGDACTPDTAYLIVKD